MGFTALSAAWLALLLIPLVIFYFLKLRRPRLQIPSLVLWQQVLADQRVNSPFQKFKRNLLLFLQLLLLALIVLAAMQPFLRREAARTEKLPILIDTSASMAARDTPGGPTRLDLAKTRARERIDTLLPGQELCLIAFSDSARALTGFTSDTRQLRTALDTLTVSDVPSDIEDGLRMAQALGRTANFGTVVLLSDGNFPARANFELSFAIDYQRLPAAGSNFGITAFNARRSVEGAWDVFVQVEGSASATPSSAKLELLRDGQPASTQSISLSPGAAPRMVFAVPGDRASQLEARLVIDGPDALAADDIAYLDLPAARPLVVNVPDSMQPWRHALAAIGGLVFAKKDADLLISDNPADLDTAAPTRCFTGLVPPALSDLLKIEPEPAEVIDWRRDANLLQHVELGDSIIMDRAVSAVGVEEKSYADRGFEVIAHGRRGPLILSQRDRASDTTWLLFNIDRSTLPYRLAFPILVSNLVQSALDRAGLAAATATKTGFAAPRVGQGRASLLSPAETSLAAVEQIQFNDRLSVTAAAAPARTDRPLWWPLALCAFALLLIEWWLFQTPRATA